VEYKITPIPKPRMTQRDKWLKRVRSPVARYIDFCWLCALERVVLPSFGAEVIFVLPMPDRWNEERKSSMDGRAHMEKPDLDNLLKALADALYGDDSGIWDIHVTKRWGREGKIVINDRGVEP
jgi:hypothetical protein